MRTALVLCPLIVLAALSLAALGDRAITAHARSEESSHATRTAPTVKATVADVPSVASPSTAPAATEIPSPADRPVVVGEKPPDAPARPFYAEVPAFANSPEGAFARAKLGILAKDEAILREATTVTDEKELKEILGNQKLLSLDIGSIEIAGDKATLHVTFEGREGITLEAVRVDGKWKIDPAAARAEAECRDCVNNLRQLGTYIVMWVSRYGEDRLYPGPGPDLFFDLFTKPTPEQSIMQGSEALLLCRASGETNTPEGVRAGDLTCTSYECISQKLADGVTDPQQPVAWDKRPVHSGKRNVLFFSGSVSTMDEAEFQALLAKFGR